MEKFVQDALTSAQGLAMWYLSVTLISIVVCTLFLRTLVVQGVVTEVWPNRFFKFMNTVIGKIFGMIGILILLILIFPDGSNFLVNWYLNKTTILQAQWSQSITNGIKDSRTATLVGLLIQKFAFNQMVLALFLGWLSTKILNFLVYGTYNSRWANWIARFGKQHATAQAAPRPLAQGAPQAPSRSPAPRPVELPPRKT